MTVEQSDRQQSQIIRLEVLSRAGNIIHESQYTGSTHALIADGGAHAVWPRDALDAVARGVLTLIG